MKSSKRATIVVCLIIAVVLTLIGTAAATQVRIAPELWIIDALTEWF
jgi:hypothetical protein